MTPPGGSRALRGVVGGVAVAAGALSARAAVAGRRWARAPDPTGGRPLELPAGRELCVVTGDGACLAAAVIGAEEHPTVVLGHGWTGERGVWASVARRLVAAGRRVVVWDQRGHGRSGLGAEGATMAALAADIAAVLEAVDARDAVLAGHSMGGMAVQAFAVAHRDVREARVSRLVAISTSARSPLRGPPGGAYERLALVAAGSVALEALSARPGIAPWAARRSFGEDPPLAALSSTRSPTPPAVRVALLREMARLDLRPSLASLGVPTAVVHGALDRVIAPALGAELAVAIPGAVLEVVPGAGHQLPLERPDRLAAILAGAPAALSPSP